MSTKRIKEIFDLVHDRMRYQTDIRNYGVEEHWKSWAKEIREGQEDIRDDCDGFATTFAELLAEEGFPLQDIAIVFCYSRQGREGHLACKVFDDERGGWYFLDNNVKRPMSESNYRSIFHLESAMYLHRPGKWVREES